ncbi:MAG: hypothetical protein A3H42_02255 [Deltaproteobacteria bacterium RIFCSPLOWO2_02_FULL_46_8]|nr:MAG: hypothetical protein A3H42_02255 [Deltaproteobacteria bacterium RIFCSPLOWO2_02_FULL_46_8]
MDNKKPRILIMHSAGFTNEMVEMLRNEMPEADIVTVADNEEEIHGALDGINALIGCPRSLFGAEILKKTKSTLRWIHASGAGCEEFLIPELLESDVVLTNGRVIQGPEVADHALALLLALTRNLHYVLRGKTQDIPRPVELRDKTAVIVGVGGVGMLVAERLHASGMRVVGVDAEYLPMVRAVDQWYLPERLHEALALADAVVLCVPVTDRTRKMFGKKAFSAMQPSAYFVNVCRGVVVDTEILTEALRQGKIKAAGLDVTDPEPLPEDHPLYSMPNVIITPHRAGLSDHNRNRSFELVRQNVKRFVKGESLINVVNKQLGY